MQDPEFDTCLDRLFVTFPAIRDWWVSLGTDDITAIRQAWFGEWRSADVRDVRAVIFRMGQGDDPAPPGDLERVGSHIAELAKKNYDRRAVRDVPRSPESASVPLHPGGAGDMYRRMLMLMDETPTLTAKQAAELVIPPADDRSGPRYDCWLCRDTGIVIVWSSVSIRAAMNGEIHLPHKRRVCGAPCRCRAGDIKVWRNSGDPPKGWSGWRNPDAVYSEDRYCACPDGDTESEKAIEEFTDWVAIRMVDADKRGRVSDFDDWNTGGHAGGKENAVAD